MTALGEWAMGLCAAGVACAVFDMLAPSGSMKRVSSLLTAVFFFCCLIGPLGEVIGDCREWFSAQATADVPVETALDDTAIKQVEQMLATSLQADAASRTASYGLTVKKVEVERDMSRSDSIYIERVRVVFAKDDQPVPDAAVNVLECAWSTPVEVYYTDGG